MKKTTTKAAEVKLVTVSVTNDEVIVRSLSATPVSGQLHPLVQQVGRNLTLGVRFNPFTLSKAGHTCRIPRSKIGAKKIVLVLTKPQQEEVIVKLA